MQCSAIDLSAGPEFHVAHVFSGSFQEATGVWQIGATEETYIDVTFEDINIGKGRVFDANDGTAIMHQFSHITAAGPHLREPFASDRMQFVILFGQPGVDPGVLCIRFFGKPK